MRFLIPAAFITAGLLVAASASADDSAAPAAAPPAVPVAPAYPAPPAYAPGYPAPYTMYPQPGAGAPPPYWMPTAAPTERRSNAMRTTGIVLFAAGGLASAVGGALFTIGATTRCRALQVDLAQPGDRPAAAHERVRSAHQALSSCDPSPGLGLGLLTGGLVTALVGIPLFVIGSKQVPARTTTGKLVPELRVGAANGELRWSF